MKRRSVLRRLAGVVPFLLALSVPAQPPAKKRQENKMNAANVLELPFSLKPEQLAGVEITYKYQSYKTGAGKQELHLLGDGLIRLVKSRAYNLPEETLEGKLQRMHLVRLLEMAEEANFFGMEPEYKSPGDPYWKRIITIKLPGGREHSVGVTNDHLHVPFENLAGAIRAVAALAVPEVLNRRFFLNL